MRQRRCFSHHDEDHRVDVARLEATLKIEQESAHAHSDQQQLDDDHAFDGTRQPESDAGHEAWHGTWQEHLCATPAQLVAQNALAMSRRRGST